MNKRDRRYAATGWGEDDVGVGGTKGPVGGAGDGEPTKTRFSLSLLPLVALFTRGAFAITNPDD